MFQLFHRISDPNSAALRRLIVELALEEVQWRNVDASESARQEMQAALGSLQIPAVLTAEGRWLTTMEDAAAHLRSLARRSAGG
ncbi:MAG: hypothetical protein KF681_10305 [Bdellovibrionaceae bacterium]|nr:hypothetical protein [Pseudobdellovibrionaceae bacterium]